MGRDIKKALLAWERLCYPKVAWNIMDIATWNSAAICKLLWLLCLIKYTPGKMSSYIIYIKGRQVWDAEPKQISWIVRKVWKTRKILEDAGLTQNDLKTFSIHKIYIRLRGDFQKVPWRKIMTWELQDEFLSCFWHCMEN